ncbi:hypothetical protein [Streptomyces sp. NPDC015125]|uniref:hypothetical protein n=1 Tax=Streptomyces sp. NPDC015125 TaxID=3364938 RepID=UPI0036F891E1
MQSSSTTSHCAPATAPASNAATRSSASAAGTPASRSANRFNRALVPAAWYCVTLRTESLLSADAFAVDSL